MTLRAVAWIALSALASAAAASPTPVSSVAWDLATVTRVANGSAPRGAALHASCDACHGAEGISTSPESPDLAGQDPRYLYKQIVDFRTGARASPQMKDYVVALSNQDAADIAAFFASRKRAASEVKPVSNAATMGLVRIGDGGRMIVACIYCHGDRGSGNSGMYGVPALEGQRGAYLQATLRAFQTGERRNDVYAPMRDTVKRLSQDEIALLASYYSGTKVAPLPPPVAPAQVAPATAAVPTLSPDGWYFESQARAGEAAYGSQCASCHGAALGGGMGPALVGKNFWSRWGGKPFSAIYTEVHARMPMQAPGSVAPAASIDILAFVLQRNGVPPGPRALTDTTDLSRALPAR